MVKLVREAEGRILSVTAEKEGLSREALFLAPLFLDVCLLV
jgi:hypothetical protein